MGLFKCRKEDKKQNLEIIEIYKNSFIKTNVEPLDKIFLGIRKGSLYIVCGGTGKGKSTFLIATAKSLAKEGKKVLYVTIEMSYERILEYIIDYDIDVYEYTGTNKSDEFTEVLDNNNYDIIIYDYLGAIGNVGEWSDLVDASSNLVQLAIKYDVPILSACQATPELEKVKLNDPSLTESSQYIAFSKHIANKVSGAAYIKWEKGEMYLICFKNRDNPKTEERILANVDMRTKTWRLF